MSSYPAFLAVVPAAGTGSRMGAERPKQYLEIGGRTLLRRSVERLLAVDWISRVLVVVAPGDEMAESLLADLDRVTVMPVGGATRRDSVLAGLESLQPAPREDDWILVHDAARPGLGRRALESLRTELGEDVLGGLLAEPLADTLKRADAQGRVASTVDRTGLWRAQTPQMFRAGPLRAALRAHPLVTDEAAAIEAAGGRPKLVAGDSGNFKVTTPADLALMTHLLASGDPA